MRIGLAVVATGRYVQFLADLNRSVREFFCVGHDIKVCALTDGFFPKEWKIGRFWWPHKPWPWPTLTRHSAILQYHGLFAEFDYVFMVDADMRFVAPVGDEILSDLVGTIHPGFWNKPRSQYTYENRPDSTACIAHQAGERYYAGGFQGGSSARYLAACKTIVDRVATDESNGITAVWHDESHWNRYLFENPPTLELDPGYCYPEAWDLPFERKLLALDKDHSAMRA